MMIKLSFVFMLLMLFACNSKPVKIEPLNSTNNSIKTESSSLSVDNNKENNMGDDVHKVTVVDSKDASRYVYLKVKEGPRDYWISTWKMPFNKGDVFYYKGGILKLNFYSKEHNMVFDTLYLISKISKVPVFAKTNVLDKVNTQSNDSEIKKTTDNFKKENIVALSKLLASPEQYKGKIIKVGGKCTKVNINIMGKNWIHLQQKDEDGQSYNLVVTSKDNARVGEECYFEGRIDTKLDLGAGYFFDVIMQEAKRIY